MLALMHLFRLKFLATSMYMQPSLTVTWHSWLPAGYLELGYSGSCARDAQHVMHALTWRRGCQDVLRQTAEHITRLETPVVLIGHDQSS